MSSVAIKPQASPQILAMAGMLALAVAMGIGRFAFTPVMPMMLEDAGLSLADGSLLASANYVGYLLGALSATMVRFPAAPAIRVALAAIALSTLAMAFPIGMAGWLSMRLLAGVASAWVLISTSAWSMEMLAPYRRPLLGSIVFAGVGVGIAVAGLLCMGLMRGHLGSVAAWAALGVFSLAITSAIWKLIASPRSSTHEASKQISKRVSKQIDAQYTWNGDAIRLVVCYGLFGFGYIIPATFLPVMAKGALRDASLFGWSWPLFGIAAALSTLSAAVFVRRLGNRRLWLVCHLVMALGVVLPVVSPGIGAIFASALFVGGTFMVITMCGMQEAREAGGAAATKLMAAMTSAFAAGQILGPLSVAYVFKGKDAFSYALVFATIVLMLSALMLLTKGKPQH